MSKDNNNNNNENPPFFFHVGKDIDGNRILQTHKVVHFEIPVDGERDNRTWKLHLRLEKGDHALKVDLDGILVPDIVKSKRSLITYKGTLGSTKMLKDWLKAIGVHFEKLNDAIENVGEFSIELDCQVDQLQMVSNKFRISSYP
jgi:hypothetical protein